MSWLIPCFVSMTMPSQQNRQTKTVQFFLLYCRLNEWFNYCPVDLITGHHSALFFFKTVETATQDDGNNSECKWAYANEDLASNFASITLENAVIQMVSVTHKTAIPIHKNIRTIVDTASVVNVRWHDGQNCPWDVWKPNHIVTVTKANAYMSPSTKVCGAHRHLQYHIWHTCFLHVTGH